MKLLAAIALAAGLTACAAEEAPPAFPYFDEEGGRVRDLANVLDADFEAELTARLDAAEAAYGYQMAVVTVPSLHGYAIEDFSLQYARAWGLGDPQRNDGLMMLIAPDERQVRIEVGLGIEDSFTDPFCMEILEDHMLPRFAESNYAQGISDGTSAIITQMRAYPTVPANDNPITGEVAEEAA